jgi:hypothetical protein
MRASRKLSLSRARRAKASQRDATRQARSNRLGIEIESSAADPSAPSLGHA